MKSKIIINENVSVDLEIPEEMGMAQAQGFATVIRNLGKIYPDGILAKRTGGRKNGYPDELMKQVVKLTKDGVKNKEIMKKLHIDDRKVCNMKYVAKKRGLL